MTTPSILKAYLLQVRQEVCRRCQVLPGGPARPGPGTPCIYELPLAQLAEALSLPGGEMAVPPAGPGEEAGPADDAVQAGFCPCPADELAALAAEATDAIRRRRRLRLVEIWNDG